MRNPEPEQAKELGLERVRGQVDFNHIRFAYSDDRDVLRDLELHITPGSSSAL